MCKYCDCDKPLLYAKTEYTNASVWLDGSGLSLDLYDDGTISQDTDIINIKFCPMCGRKLGDE